MAQNGPEQPSRPLGAVLSDGEILHWLRTEEPEALKPLYDEADRVRAATVGKEVHLRGLIEASNTCVRACGYCGISLHHQGLVRYRMTKDEILECGARGKALGYGTLVIQAGEDPGLTPPLVAEVIRELKARFPEMAVTLSLGEQTEEVWALWKEAGADRYLLRFETSNPDLYRSIHPPRHGHAAVSGDVVPRIPMLRTLQKLGYQAGTGVMVGIPGQTWQDLVSDLRTFQKLDIEMIGIGPYIPHPETPLAHAPAAPEDRQVPGTVAVALRMVALSRILVPDANIPATTAVATLDQKQGREDALKAGANVVMPNLTPPKYRSLYEIYPDKACVNETAEQCHGCLSGRIARVGRTVGKGPGHAPKTKKVNIS